MKLTVRTRKEGETAKEYAYRILRQNIVTLAIEPGSSLNDAEIAERLGISRTPVREAISQLKSESGIIEIYPQRGMKVALIDMEIVREVCLLRLITEKAMAERVIDMADEADIAWMENNVKLQAFCAKEKQADRFMELDNELHEKMFRIARCDLIYTITKSSMIHFDRVRELESESSAAAILQDHKDLIEAIRKKDREKAKEILEIHLNRYIPHEKELRKKYADYFKKENENQK
jgi:DNA-binding GntR family transcriptional regulator